MPTTAERQCLQIAMLSASNVNRCVAHLAQHKESIMLIASGEACDPEDFPPGVDIRAVVMLLAHFYLAHRHHAYAEDLSLDLSIDAGGTALMNDPDRIAKQTDHDDPGREDAHRDDPEQHRASRSATGKALAWLACLVSRVIGLDTGGANDR